jgi:hypothetical protein
VSSLLHRLAAQALGSAGPGIRTAAKAHAQVPLAMPAHNTPAATLERDRSVSPAFAPAHPSAQQTNRREAPDVIPFRDTLPFAASQAHRPPAIRALDAPSGAAPSLPSPQRLARETRFSPRASQPPVATAPHRVAEVSPAASMPGGASRISPRVEARPLTPPAEEPVEVHVHIGRIEVNALQATPAARQDRAAAARPTLTLSEYLARRNSR